jgi:hypothetical protein
LLYEIPVLQLADKFTLVILFWRSKLHVFLHKGLL